MIGFIREKCVEANPGIVINEHAQLHRFGGTVEYFKQMREIRLADVLYLIEQIYTRHDIVTEVDYYNTFGDIIARWNLLKDNVNDQSDECIELIFNLLSK